MREETGEMAGPRTAAEVKEEVRKRLGSKRFESTWHEMIVSAIVHKGLKDGVFEMPTTQELREMAKKHSKSADD